MEYLVFHPDMKLHPTDNEQTIEMNRIFEKKNIRSFLLSGL